jgi:dolichol-phosphate mannosyltransferase
MTLVDLEMNAMRAGRARRVDRGGGQARMAPAIADLCIVVPTYNERDNISELVDRVRAAMGAASWEMIIVDDESPDRTGLEARLLGQSDPRVRLIRRIGRRGAASACLEGLLASNATYLAVMDADLQHDPLALPAMVAMLRAGNAELVVAGDESGRPAGDWPEPRESARRLAIRATQLAGSLTLRDPLCGYFAMRRDLLDRTAPRLAGRGPKLLPDILLAAPDVRVSELPLAFSPRLCGESKFSARAAWDYAAMLAGHRIGTGPGRLLAYLPIAAVVLLLHAGAFWLFHDLYGLGMGGAQLIAGTTLCSATYGLREWLSYRRSGPWRWYLGLIPFLATRTIGLLAALLIARWLIGAGLPVAVSASAGAVALVWWNYDAVHRYGGFAR